MLHSASFCRVDFFTLVTAFFTISLCCPVSAQRLPDTPVGDRMAELLECINEPDASKRTDFLQSGFVEQNATAFQSRIGKAARMHLDFRSLEVETIVDSSEYHMTVRTQAASGAKVQFEIAVSKKPPHQISSVDLKLITLVDQDEFVDVLEMPEGPRGEHVKEILAVLNANDGDKVREFIASRTTERFQKAVPMDTHLKSFASVFLRSRGLEFYSVRKYPNAQPSDELVVVVRNKLTQSFESVVLEFESTSPQRITKMRFSGARSPKNLIPSKQLTDSEVVSELEAFVDRLAEAEVFSGTVLLAVGDSVLCKKACGLASRRFNARNTVDTKFNLGSMNKMFTAVSVLQLVQNGKITLDDPLSMFVDEDWIEGDAAGKIKIKHLLSHTSGLGSYFNKTFFESSKNLYRELADYKPLISGATPRFEPGTKWAYSNTGMFLLGVVIEQASGENYFDYVRGHVYNPARMLNSDCYDMDKPVSNLAIGYFKEDGHWKNNLYLNVLRGGPAGGGFSTVEDLNRFAQALLAHELLDREHTQMLLTAKPNSPDYGFGFQIKETPAGPVVGHSGGFMGINSQLDVYLEHQITVAVMSNTDRGAGPITNKIQELISRRREIK